MESFTQPTQPVLETLNFGYVTGLKRVQTYPLGQGEWADSSTSCMHAMTKRTTFQKYRNKNTHVHVQVTEVGVTEDVRKRTEETEVIVENFLLILFYFGKNKIPTNNLSEISYLSWSKIPTSHILVQKAYPGVRVYSYPPLPTRNGKR